MVVCQKGIVAADPFYHAFVLEEFGEHDRLVEIGAEFHRAHTLLAKPIRRIIY